MNFRSVFRIPACHQMDPDDFLWQCAFESQGKDRLWIIPDRDDLFVTRPQRNGRREHQSSSSSYRQVETFRVLTSNQPDESSGNNDDVDEKETIKIRIVEQRGQGVCDVIGGEVWEAALLLSAYLLIHWWQCHSENNKPRRILELGSGVGLPSILLSKLQHRLSNNKLGIVRSITMTDFDQQLVNNLVKAITLQFPVELMPTIQEEMYDNGTDTALEISAGSLDWEIFMQNKNNTHQHQHLLKDRNDNSGSDDDFMGGSDNDSDGNEDDGDINRKGAPFEKHFGLPMELRHNQFHVLIGSALCYAPYHSNCLASLIEYYLQADSSVEEIIIIQIHDREGFHTLLARLDEMPHVRYTLEDVAEEVYNYASQFYRSAGSQSIDPQRSDAVINLQRDRDEEDINTFVFDYFFPLSSRPKYLQHVEVDIDMNVSEEQLTINNRNHSNYKFNLLQTDREAFRLLRIVKNIPGR